MISQKYINGLGFSTLEEVFQYVVDSRQNGQFSQVKELLKRMSVKQYADFLLWLKNEGIEIESMYIISRNDAKLDAAMKVR